jgi:hypothetical protein
MLGALAFCVLAGCAEEKIPVGLGVNDHPYDASQIIAVYAQLTGKAVEAPPEVRNDEAPILIKQTKPLTRSQACKLLEQDLREQAGIIILHQNRKHVVFGFKTSQEGGL